MGANVIALVQLIRQSEHAGAVRHLQEHEVMTAKRHSVAGPRRGVAVTPQWPPSCNGSADMARTRGPRP